MSPQSPFPWQANYWSRLVNLHSVKKLSHAYLITGLKDIGKYQFACEFSRYLLCRSPSNGNACGNCDNCSLGHKSDHPDCMKIFPDDKGRVIKVDHIRSLSEFFSQTSHAGGAKIALINNANYLNTAASNALLKTLEEPSDKTFIFLCSDSPSSLLQTIRSRCQTIQMTLPEKSIAINWLQQSVVTPCDFDSLLNSAKGRPLYALELQKNDLLAVEERFINLFLELTTGKISLQLIVKAIKDIGEVIAIDYLINLFSNTTKALLHGSLEDQISSQEKTFLDICSASNLSTKNVALAFFKFHDELLVARRHLSETNLNTQLIVESLVWQWHSLWRE
ncbi:MAG: DNA polymerase III subunit delta' [Gammaproteobacteria bacterium]|nr:DNA polymerase III subunit delta' [Gammaproteobacteria bacterium]